MLRRLKKNFWDYAKVTLVLCLMFSGMHWSLGLICLAARLIFDAVDVYLFLPARRILRRDRMEEYELEDI